MGHCNCATDIKEVTFLGSNDELVACGSDDGCVFIYNAVRAGIAAASMNGSWKYPGTDDALVCCHIFALVRAGASAEVGLRHSCIIASSLGQFLLMSNIM